METGSNASASKAKGRPPSPLREVPRHKHKRFRGPWAQLIGDQGNTATTTVTSPGAALPSFLTWTTGTKKAPCQHPSPDRTRRAYPHTQTGALTEGRALGCKRLCSSWEVGPAERPARGNLREAASPCPAPSASLNSQNKDDCVHQADGDSQVPSPATAAPASSHPGSLGKAHSRAEEGRPRHTYQPTCSQHLRLLAS